MTTGKRAERTKHDFRCSICRTAIGQWSSQWSSQLFDLRAPSSSDVPVLLLNRELKQQRRRRLQKRHSKSEFAPLQTLSRLFHLVYFVECWQMCLELNSKGLYRSSRKEKKVVVLCSRPRQNVNSGTFTL